MSVHDWDLKFQRVVEQERQSYASKSTMPLIGLVDNVLQLNSFRRRYTLDKENAKVCAHCGEPLGSHSFIGWRCPNRTYEGDLYLISTFAERKVSDTCMAIIPTNSIATEGCACGRPAVGNTEMCERHLAENGI